MVKEKKKRKKGANGTRKERGREEKKVEKREH